MIKSIFNLNSSSILKQTVANIIKAVAIEETALSNILNLENDIIQKAKNHSVNLEEYVSINESVNSILKNITEVQIITQRKLHYLKELLQKTASSDENDALEE